VMHALCSFAGLAVGYEVGYARRHAGGLGLTISVCGIGWGKTLVVGWAPYKGPLLAAKLKLIH
jgi:hypothetical protein